MRYLPPGSMRRQRWLGRLEGSIVSVAVVCILGFSVVAATPLELYRPAAATHQPTPQGELVRFQHVQMPPCGAGKDCNELDDGAFALPPQFDPLPSPYAPHNTHNVPEPGTLALVGAGVALMLRKVK